MNAISAHSTSELSAANLASPELAVLSARQRERLATLLDDYMQAREAGTPISQEDLLAENPSLADVLRVYLRSLDDLHDMAGGFAADTQDFHEPMGMEERARGRIGDFELIREVGRGGMGVVYEARQIPLERRVAVKVLPFAAILDSKQIARFKNEAQAAAQVQHPNIVPVFDIGVERGVHFYAMEFIDGQPLDRAIAELKNGPFRSPPGRGMRSVDTQSVESTHRWTDVVRTIHDEQARMPDDESIGAAGSHDVDRHHARRSFLAQASKNPTDYFRTVAGLGIQAAEALHAAHEHGVVHRDIKPSNLLLDGAGKLWVTDFGLARCRRDVTLTASGDVVGTIRYMSPEQAAGQTSLVDHRTDIYSLGVTLYELVCLRAAFPEEHGPELLRKIDSREPPRPRDLRSDVPKDLENVILKGMAPSRDERYASAQQMADDLRRVMEGRPTIARPPTAAERLVKWSRRHRKAVAASVAAMLVSLVGLTIATMLLARERTRAQNKSELAEHFFNEAQDVLDQFGGRLSDQLADVPGAEGVRQAILHSTRDFYLRFVGEAEDDSELQSDIATTYSKIASLADQIGSPDEAVAAYEESLRRFKSLAKSSPDTQENQEKLALTTNNLALVHGRAGRTVEALEYFTQAIELQADLTTKAPGDATILGNLALFYNNLGLLQSEMGQAARARASFASAVRLLEGLSDGQSRDADRQRKLAAAYNNLASSYLNSDPAHAVELHQQALSLQIDAAAAYPEDLSLQREVALTLNNLGSAHSRTDSPLRAYTWYDKAMETQQQLARRHPNRLTFQCDLAVSYNNVGMLHTRLGKDADAKTAFHDALKHYHAVLDDRPDEVLARSGLGGVYHNLGILLERAGQLDESAEAFFQAIVHQRKAAAEAPGVVRFARFLSDHQSNYNRVLQKAGHHDEVEPL